MNNTPKYNPKYIQALHEHKTPFIVFFLLCIVYTVLGSIVGGSFEILTKKINKKYGYSISLVYQIIINAIFLSLMRFYILPIFVIQLQTITYGLLFSATYFGIQFSLYNNSLKMLEKIL